MDGQLGYVAGKVISVEEGKGRAADMLTKVTIEYVNLSFGGKTERKTITAEFWNKNDNKRSDRVRGYNLYGKYICICGYPNPHNPELMTGLSVTFLKYDIKLCKGHLIFGYVGGVYDITIKDKEALKITMMTYEDRSNPHWTDIVFCDCEYEGRMIHNCRNAKKLRKGDLVLLKVSDFQEYDTGRRIVHSCYGNLFNIIAVK